MDARPGEPEQGSDDARSGPPLKVAIPISLAAVLLAAAHLIWPDLKIDAVTLALLGIAIVPWLAPIFKSVELPGGWRFEYQEIRRQVREVARRVEGVERLLFTGDTTPKLEQRLTAAVQAFAEYLRGLHPSLDVSPPKVRLRHGLRNAHYALGEIQLDPDFAEDDYPMLREYARHVLATVHGSPSRDIESGYAGLDSGVADYLVASYTGKPGLGAAVASQLARTEGFDDPYIRDLANDLPIDQSSQGDLRSEGAVWGAALWELREWLGQSKVDELVVAAWIDADWIGEGRPPGGFPPLILRALDDSDGERARKAFERRRLPILET